MVFGVGKGVLLEMCPHCKSGIWGGKRCPVRDVSSLQEWYLGWEKVERCLQFRDVLIERGSTVD